MKTSIVAVIAASLFLAAAYMGIGSAWKPPRPPQMIVLSGPSVGVATPTANDQPSPLPSASTGSPQVLAVGRQVQQGSLQGGLKDLPGSRGSGPPGSTSIAVGPSPTPSDQMNPTVDGSVQVNGSGSGATPGSNAGSPPAPRPTRSPAPNPRPRPRPTQTRTPPPTPTPTPTPTPSVTDTVTPPVTTTVTPPGSSFSPTP
jgi:hypothetical protein